jgi:hypothetical protein
MTGEIDERQTKNHFRLHPQDDVRVAIRSGIYISGRKLNGSHAMLKYKGYTGSVKHIGEARIFHGEVLGTRDVITFQGRTTDEIEMAFRDSIDDYMEFCEKSDENLPAGADRA